MNFVFIVSEQLRAESLPAYGHPLVKTPNFDRVASEGVVFDNCYAQNPVCTPSRCCMMTGLYPHVNGHRTLWHLLRNHENSLFRYLKEKDYHIEWHGKNDLYSQTYFDGVVDNCNSAPGRTHGDNLFEYGEPGYYSFLHKPFPGKAEETNDGLDNRAGINFLESRKPGDKPFMLYLPMSLSHPEYAAPEPFHSMYNPKDVPPLRPAGLKNKPSFYELIRKYRDIENMDEDFFREINAKYLGMISCADYLIGKILDTLDKTGLAEDTAVILTADHGDFGGDFGLVEKWPNCFDDTNIKVPLIIKMPKGKKGIRNKGLVEHFDISATVLEAAGIKASHTNFAQSLLPALMEGKEVSKDAVFAEGGYDTHEPHCFEGRGDFFDDKTNMYYPKGIQQQEHPESVCRTTMMRKGDYKIIVRTSDKSELYDLKNDPQELNNIYYNESYTRLVCELEREMNRWYISSSDIVPFDEDKRGL